MTSVLLTGGSGLLALNWSRILADSWTVHRTIHRRSVSVPDTHAHIVDLTSVDQIDRLLGHVAPQLVIHTAGMTAVEQCEADPQGAFEANVSVARNVASICAKHAIALAHISTDHLFDGTKPLVTEDDNPTPLNVYAQTKADGEKAVLDAAPDALVVRTNFYGWGPGYRPSFSDWIVGALRRREQIALFDDVHYSPILMDVLVEVVQQLVADGAHGIYNVVGDERLTKYDFGVKLAEHFGLDGQLIRRSSIADKTGLVVRPLDMSLSNRKVTEKLGRRIGDVVSHIKRLAAVEDDLRVKAIRAL